MSQGLERVRQAARQGKRQAFTALLHHVNVDALRDVFLALKRRAAPGVDGMTWQDYESGLEEHLLDLHTRVHRGTYRALPVRRRFIPKPDGRQRPLGIAALEDKIVQRAVVTVLNAIYEEDFLVSSAEISSNGFLLRFWPSGSARQPSAGSEPNAVAR